MDPKTIATLINLVINSALRGDIDSPTMKTLIKALHSGAGTFEAKLQVNEILADESIDSLVESGQKTFRSRAIH